MKTVSLVRSVAATVALLFVLAIVGQAGEPLSPGGYKVDWKKAEKNYIASLNCENCGVRQSAIHFLGEYRLKGGVEPLIGLLKTCPDENTRMAAALALLAIEDQKGIEAIQEASMYDGSDKVAKFCENLLSASYTSLTF